MRRGRAVAWLLGPLGAALIASLPSCGARSSLTVEAGPDALVSLDEEETPDAGLDAPPDVAPVVSCVLDADCNEDDEVNLCKPRGCVAGKCQSLTPVNCDDKDPCTEDKCEPATGKCTSSPLSFDLDKDGFKGPRPGTKAGDPGSCGDDCDDTSALAFPGGKELCDGVDNDCNGVIDDQAKYIPVDEEPVLVSEATLDKGYAAGIAYSGGKQGYLASYTGEKSSDTGVYTRPIQPLGQPGEPISKVNGSTGDASGGPMVWTGDRYGMAWSDRRDGNYEIYFNIFSADGPKLGPDVRLSDAFGFSVNPSIAWNGNSFYVVWQDDRTDRFEVYARRMSLEAKSISIDVPLSTPSGFEQNAESPSIAATSQGIAIVHRQGDSFTSQILFRAYNEQLDAVGPVVVLASGANYIDPIVATNGDKYIVVWGEKQPFRVYGTVIDLLGKTVIPATELSPPDGSPYRRPLVLPLGDRVIVTYSRQQDDGYELFSRTFSQDLTPQSPPQQLTTRVGDDFGQTLLFGPSGDVGVLFDGKLVDNQGLRAGAFFTRLRCDASAFPGKP